MHKKSIYICHTPYQVLITLVKNINNCENDIMLCDTIPNYESLAKNMNERFEKIYIFKEKEMSKEFNVKKIEKKIFRTNQTIKMFEKYIDIDLKSYQDIYIFNDWTMVGAYLIDNKIRYHLIEDGLNAFYYIKENFKNKITFLNPTPAYKVKHFMKKMLHIGYDFFGQSKYVIDIEVNDIKKIYIKNKNIIEVPRAIMFEKLTKKEREEIYSIFSSNKIKDFKSNKKRMLLLTQPLYKDKFVKSIDEQVDIYDGIIKKYKDRYDIFIKAHPRDDYNYKEKYKDIILIDKYMPIEILNFVETLSFDLAVTICSSSIETLNFVKKRIILGLDYIEERKK